LGALYSAPNRDFSLPYAVQASGKSSTPFATILR
jgi:hypothetical protein